MKPSRRFTMRLWMILCMRSGQISACVIFPRIRKKLLELACGTGIQSICFKQAGLEVTGLDLSQEMLDLAREALAERPVLDISHFIPGQYAWILSGHRSV